MDFYRAYNVDEFGNTLSFKGFPSASDRDACMQALTLKQDGKWHTMELWTGIDRVDCSALSERGKGRQILLPTE